MLQDWEAFNDWSAKKCALCQDRKCSVLTSLRGVSEVKITVLTQLSKSGIFHVTLLDDCIKHCFIQLGLYFCKLVLSNYFITDNKIYKRRGKKTCYKTMWEEKLLTLVHTSPPDVLQPAKQPSDWYESRCFVNSLYRKTLESSHFHCPRSYFSRQTRWLVMFWSSALFIHFQQQFTSVNTCTAYFAVQSMKSNLLCRHWS